MDRERHVERDAGLGRKIFGRGGAGAVKVDRYRISCIVNLLDTRLGMTTHGIAARSLDIRCKLTRGVHPADVRSRFGNSNEGDANDNRHHGDGDQQLDRAEPQLSVLRFRFHHFLWMSIVSGAREGGLRNNPRRLKSNERAHASDCEIRLNCPEFRIVDPKLRYFT